jgi:hypothetical protein
MLIECSPSATFWHQLVLLYNADGRFTLRDRSTRQYYMERTTSQFLSKLRLHVLETLLKHLQMEMEVLHLLTRWRSIRRHRR